MASGALGRRSFRGGLLVWQWMMSVGEEAPAVRLCEALAVFYGHIDAVVHTVKIPASGGFTRDDIQGSSTWYNLPAGRN